MLILRGHGRTVILDGGGFGFRRVLEARLAQHGVSPTDITDVLVSHSHHDHVVDWPLFRHARIWIDRKELAWALGVPWGETSVAEHTIEVLSRWPTLQLVDDRDEVLPGITAFLAPGHTPGHLISGLPETARTVCCCRTQSRTGWRWRRERLI